MYRSSIEWWHYTMAGAVLLLVLVMFCQAVPRLTAPALYAENRPGLSDVH